MKKLSYFLLATMLLCTLSCKDNPKEDDLVFEKVIAVEVTPLNGGAMLTWTLPAKAIGVKIVYILVDGGEPVVKMFPKEITSYELEGYVDTKERTITVFAVFSPSFLSEGYTVSVTPLLPRPPAVKKVQVVYRPEDVLIKWTTPDIPEDMELTGYKLVYTLYEGEDEIVIEIPPDENEAVLTMPEDVDQVTVVIYAIYVDNKDNDRVSKGVVVAIVTLPPVPVTDIKVENLPGGAKISWTPPERTDYMGAKVIFAYGNGGRFFELYKPAGLDFVELEGYSNTKEHPVSIHAVFGRGIDDGVVVNIKPEPMPWYGQVFDLPGRSNSMNMNIWEPLDEGTENYQQSTTFRGDLFVPSNRMLVNGGQRGWQNYVYEWSSGSGADPMWQPGGDAVSEQRLSHYIPGIDPDDVIPYPLYITFDMGRKAFYDKLAFLIRARGGGPVFPVIFHVWGANEIKPSDEIGNGSRADNLAYWTNWEVAGGTDAWKKDWTKIASCRYVFKDGPLAGLNRIPSGFNNNTHLGNSGTTEDRRRFDGTQTPLLPHSSFVPGANTNRGYGYDFDLTTEGVKKSFRYLRWEIELLSADERNGGVTTRSVQFHALKFWGTYDE